MLLKNKLILNNLAAALVLIMLVCLSYFDFNKLGNVQDEGYRSTLDSATAINDTYIASRMYSVVADTLINQNFEQSKKDWAEVKVVSIKEMEEVEAIAESPEEKAAVQKAKEALNTYINIYENEYLPLIKSLKKDQLTPEIRAVDDKVDTQKKIIEENLKVVTTAQKANADKSDKEFDLIKKSEMNIFLLIAIVSIVVLVIVAYGIIRSIGRALGADPNDIYDVATKISKGILDFNIPLADGDKTSSMAAMSVVQTNVKLLISDASKLSQAAVEGKLSARADASRHEGDFRKVIEGVNATLDAVIGPLNVSANYVDRISKGDIPNRITDTFNGDFNVIKTNLNTCIDAITKLVADVNILSSAAVEGKLSVRADASQHQGDYRKIIDGVNHTLDAVIGPLNVAAGYVDHFAKGNIPSKITDSYNGDFNIIKNNLNACADALNLLVEDTNRLSQAAKNDQLNTRADAAKHWGDYRKIVEGVNGTLDTVMHKNAADAAEKENEAQLLSSAVEETQAIIEDAKTGDLSNRVSLTGKTGAIASLCDGINALMDKMTEIIVQVREAGDTINTAAGEISSGNSDLSSRTEQQASSLEETAASMEELASTVKNNAENAKQANQLAATASDVAIKGGEVVGQVVNTMTAINQSAHKIEDIISVIDGIAFQTNILALNAAVEAARAGEQGRGFAVVAGEVRNLAQRSASAAKEIKELITDSVNKTAEGTAQVETAGKTMQEIVTSVQRVTDIMGEITAASVEQSSGIDQVNTAVTSMDEVTQQNAALVEQAAAAAESLVDQAAGLIDVVSAFKLSGGNSLALSKSKNRPLVRIASNSAASTPIARPSPAKIVAKNGTDDNEWEEF